MSQTLLMDCATPIDPRDIKAAGYVAAIRYVAPADAEYDWKRVTRDEIDGLHEQGLALLFVWESYATRALEGMSAGMADARDAVAQAAALGLPADVPIFFACDTDATADKTRPYFRGVTAIRTCSGAYGGIRVVDPLLADGTVRWGWQTCAWSNNVVSQSAHLYQRLRPTLKLAGSFDEDVLLRALPMWTPPAAVTAPPAPIPAPPQRTGAHPMGVYIIRVTDGPLKDAEFYDYGFGPVHIDGPESVELVAAPNPIPVKAISGGLFAKRFPGLQ